MGGFYCLYIVNSTPFLYCFLNCPVIYYRNCIACKILNEDARYKGKEKPFTHTFIDRKIQSRILFEPTFYIGLKIILKDKTELAIYTSKEKTYSGTDQYRIDHAKAEEIKKFIDKIIKTYNN